MTESTFIEVTRVRGQGDLGDGFIACIEDSTQRLEEPLPKVVLFSGELFLEPEDGGPVFEPEVFGYRFVDVGILPEGVLHRYVLKD